MSPTSLLIGGIIAILLGVLGAVLNMASAVGSSRDRNLASVFVVHGVCALFYIGGIISVVVSIAMYLINYSKG